MSNAPSPSDTNKRILNVILVKVKWISIVNILIMLPNRKLHFKEKVDILTIRTIRTWKEIWPDQRGIGFLTSLLPYAWWTIQCKQLKVGLGGLLSVDCYDRYLPTCNSLLSESLCQRNYHKDLDCAKEFVKDLLTLVCISRSRVAEDYSASDKNKNFWLWKKQKHLCLSSYNKFSFYNYISNQMKERLLCRSIYLK